jgi:glycosyltransferase involved in cell wall biosynthesis
MSTDRVIAVIPALNEQETIASVVTGLEHYVDEVVVVDDGSTDDTAEKASDAGATVVSHERNRGYDRSLADGFQMAADKQATIIVTFDADDQHCPEDIPAVLSPIQSDEAAVVIGKRPNPARITEALFAVYTRARFGVTDPLSGFKSYRTDVYRDVGHFSPYTSVGTHLMLEAHKRGYKIAEVDIQFEDRHDDSRFGQSLEANWKILCAMVRSIYRVGID